MLHLPIELKTHYLRLFHQVLTMCVGRDSRCRVRARGVVSLSDCCRQDKPQPQPRAEFKSWPRVASTRFPHESLPRTQSAPFLLPLYSLLLIRRSICSVPVGTQPHGATWDVARELGRRTCRQLPRFGLATSLKAPSNPCHPPPPPPITKHRPLSS